MGLGGGARRSTALQGKKDKGEGQLGLRCSPNKGSAYPAGRLEAQTAPGGCPTLGQGAMRLSDITWEVAVD